MKHISLFTAKRLLKKYALTPDDVQKMLTEQHNCCALCDKPFSEQGQRQYVVDHDHGTGVVRGLLHGVCNTALGVIEDNFEWVEQALVYLAESEGLSGEEGVCGGNL